MPTYYRIKLDITDLSPESASKVFQFLHTLLVDHSLDLNYFKHIISKSDIGEQYFILKYAKLYFSHDPDSYLNNWLKKLDVENQIIEDNNSFELIITNISIILNYIENNEKTIERQYKFCKKNEFDYSNLNVIRYKIPLRSLTIKTQFDGNLRAFETPIFIGKTDEERTKKENYIIEKPSDYFLEFKSNVFRILANIFDESQIEKLFYNSFSLQRSDKDPNCLNLEFKDSKILYDAFFEIYQTYNSEKNSGLRVKQILEQRKQNKEIKRTRKKFVAKLSNNKITKLDIMKIMYNSFPQIRDTYKSFAKKNPSTDLNKYLLTKSRNIKKI